MIKNVKISPVLLNQPGRSDKKTVTDRASDGEGEGINQVKASVLVATVLSCGRGAPCLDGHHAWRFFPET